MVYKWLLYWEKELYFFTGMIKDYFTRFIKLNVEGGFKTKRPFGLITLIINIFQTIQKYFKGVLLGLLDSKTWMV